MAIIKMKPPKAGKIYGLKAILDYIQNPHKTDGGLLVSAKDCLLESAFKQMVLTKEDFQKCTGRQYIHIIQSFAKDDVLTPEIAHEIGARLAESFAGFQAVVATHTNCEHCHNHIVLNTVNFETGVKWQQTQDDLKALKAYSDSLCKEYGLSVIDTSKKNHCQNYGEYKSGMKSWKAELAEAVAEAVKSSFSRQGFIHKLYEKGIEVDFGRNNVMFTIPDGKKCGSNKLDGYGDFSKENLEKYFDYNCYLIKRDNLDGNFISDAYYQVGVLLAPSNPNCLNDKVYANEEFTELEGQALMEYIIKKKSTSHIKWIAENNQNHNSSQAYLLVSADELFRAAYAEKHYQEQYQHENYHEEDEDEWEM